MEKLKEEILTTCLNAYTGSFASGKTANNKLDLDNIPTESVLFKQIVSGMADLIVARYVDVDEIDAIAATPFGGDRFAIGISDVLMPMHKIPVAFFKKNPHSPPDKKLFLPRNDIATRTLRNASTVVVVDDVTNEFTSALGMAENTLLAGKQLSFCSAVHRGMPEAANHDFKWDTLVKLPLPRILPDDSPLWRYVSEANPV